MVEKAAGTMSVWACPAASGSLSAMAIDDRRAQRAQKSAGHETDDRLDLTLDLRIAQGLEQYLRNQRAFDQNRRGSDQRRSAGSDGHAPTAA